MPTSDSIFRDYKPAEAERSDRSAGDRLRHRQKVRESIRENIADIIAEESIIGKNKDRVIKVPLRGIKEYRFVFGENAPGAGTGDGNAQEGQVIGKAGQQPGQGNEGQGGDKPGVDYYETDVTLEELIDIMFEDLELPNLERKALREVMSDKSSKRKGYRQVGIRVRLDKRRSAKQRVMRMLATQRGTQSAAPDSLPRMQMTRARISRTSTKLTRPSRNSMAAGPPGHSPPRACASASRFISATCATSISRPTRARSPTPSSCASWILRARWTP